MSKYVVYEGSDEWSALYVDGTLDRVGDHYLIDERLRALFGVTEVTSDAFLRGGTHREDVAPTLDAIKDYERQQATDALATAEAERQEEIQQLQARLAELNAAPGAEPALRPSSAETQSP